MMMMMNVIMNEAGMLTAPFGCLLFHMISQKLMQDRR